MSRVPLAAVAASLLLVACSAPSTEPAPELTADVATASPMGRATVSRFEIGRSVEGRPILATLADHPGASLARRPTVMIIASIHGDEPAGTPLLEALLEHLRTRPELMAGRRVLLIDVMNPDGYAKGRRRNANNVDLNRNVDEVSWRPRRTSGPGPSSEPETAALLGLLDRYRPDRVISIHQPIGCVDYDGPGEALARAMSAVCGLPVRRLGTRPGSLGAHVGETLGRPIITLELPGRASRLDRDELWERYGAALLVAISS